MKEWWSGAGEQADLEMSTDGGVAGVSRLKILVGRSLKQMICE